MSNRIYEWRVTNTSTSRVAFDDKNLEPQGVVVIHRLTDDVLSGHRQGKLLISPDPGALIPHLASMVALNPCQFPIPVRLVGETTHPVGNSLVDGVPINIAVSTRIEVVPSDRRRQMFRLKNLGTQSIWLGGNAVTELTAFIEVLPGTVYLERDVPTAAWFAYVAANLNNVGSIFRVQQIFTGTL